MIGVAVPTSPYKGLAAFEDSDLDALLFFGREQDREVIAANLMASRLTVLFGPTGVGKTSVLRAGVAYRLRREAGVEILVYSSWASDPVAGMIEAAGGSGNSLADALSEAAARAGGDLYVVADQFEEYFVYRQHDQRFVRELAEVLRRPGLRVNVLIGIREDALAQLDVFKAAIPNLLSNRLRLERLDRAAGEAAILGPLRRFNELVPPEDTMEIEPELVTAVLDEVTTGRLELGVAGRGAVDGRGEDDRIETPYLQLVLARLWEVETARESRTLRLETLRGLGGAAHIVEDHLEHAMAELSPREKASAAAMYNFLVTPSGMKIAHDVRDLAGYAQVDEEEASNVLRRLADERIVRATSDDGAGARYEIYHDVLAEAVLAWRTRYTGERAVHDAERRRRRALFIATAALVGLVLVAGIAVFALLERSHSRSEARRARARELAAAATAKLETDPHESVRLALRGGQLEPGRREEDVLRLALLVSKERRVFRAGSPIVATSFDPRGRRLLIAARDGKVRLYRVGSTEPEAVLNHGARLRAAAFGDDGTLVLTAGRDGSARLWRAADGTALRTFSAGGPIRAAFFGGSDRLVATLTQNGVIRIWGTRDGRLLKGFRVHGKALPKDGVMDSRGRVLVTVGHDRFARVYSVKTGRLVAKLAQHGFVRCVAFSPDGTLLLTCGYEGTVRLWRVGTWTLFHELRGPGSGVVQAVFSPGGKLVAGASNDGTTRVWETQTGFQYAVLLGHRNQVTQVAFSPSGGAIVTGSSDNTAKTWVQTGRIMALLAGHSGPITAASFSPDGRTVVTGSEDGTTRLWDPGTEPELAVVAREPGRVTAMAVSPGGGRVITGDETGLAHVRMVVRGRILRTLRTSGPVTAVAFGPSGPVAASAPVRSLAFSTDGRWRAEGRTGMVVLRDLRGGRARTLRVGDGEVGAVAFSPDGRVLAAGDEGGLVRLWKTDSARRLHELRAHALAVTSLAFSPDGERLLTSSLDKHVVMWEVRSGGRLKSLLWHFGPVSGASFSRDGRWILTAGPGTAGLGPASTGELLVYLFSYPKHARGRPLTAAHFAGRDSRVIVSAGKDGTIRTYRCDICGNVDELIALAKRRVGSP